MAISNASLITSYNHHHHLLRMSGIVQYLLKYFPCLPQDSLFPGQVSSANMLEWLPITLTTVCRSLLWPARSHVNGPLPSGPTLSPTTCSLGSFAPVTLDFCFHWNWLPSFLFQTGWFLSVRKVLPPQTCDLLFQDIHVSGHTSSQQGLPLYVKSSIVLLLSTPLAILLSLMHIPEIVFICLLLTLPDENLGFLCSGLWPFFTLL